MRATNVRVKATVGVSTATVHLDHLARAKSASGGDSANAVALAHRRTGAD